MIECFRMTCPILSMYICGLLHTSSQPKPAGLPSTRNSVSNTKGYLPCA